MIKKGHRYSEKAEEISIACLDSKLIVYNIKKAIIAFNNDSVYLVHGKFIKMYKKLHTNYIYIIQIYSVKNYVVEIKYLH